LKNWKNRKRRARVQDALEKRSRAFLLKQIQLANGSRNFSQQNADNTLSACVLLRALCSGASIFYFILIRELTNNLQTRLFSRTKSHGSWATSPLR
jgi:hypothetical protein